NLCSSQEGKTKRHRAILLRRTPKPARKMASISRNNIALGRPKLTSRKPKTADLLLLELRQDLEAPNNPNPHRENGLANQALAWHKNGHQYRHTPPRRPSATVLPLAG